MVHEFTGGKCQPGPHDIMLKDTRGTYPNRRYNRCTRIRIGGIPPDRLTERSMKAIQARETAECFSFRALTMVQGNDNCFSSLVWPTTKVHVSTRMPASPITARSHHTFIHSAGDLPVCLAGMRPRSVSIQRN